MRVIPAIDLLGGAVVRLQGGDYATPTVYTRDPAEKARAFAAAGATLVHVVDLDGAKAGRPVNLDAVAAVCQVPGIEVELGGGLRILPDIERVLGLGVRYVVLGTAAVERLGLVEDACARFPGRVRCGIDAKGGEVTVAGWAEGTGLPVADVARRVKGAGVEVVASGGVATLDDVRACRAAGLAGVIVGKALYEKRIDLAEAIRLADGAAATPAPAPELR